MSNGLRTTLNSIIDDRRLVEDLSADDPSIPPAPTAVNVTAPKRAVGGSAAFGATALYPAGLDTTQAPGGGTYVLLSSTAPAYPSSQSTGAARTRVGGPEVNTASNASLSAISKLAPS